MISWILAVVLGVIAIIFLYLNRVYNYWLRKGLPQPPITYGFGNIFEAFTLKKSSGYIYTEIYRSYPEHDAVGVYTCHTPKLLVRSPELIQRVMVSDFSSFHDNEFFVTKKLDPYFYLDPFNLRGEEWKPARAKLASTVSGARVKEIFPLMKEVIPRLDNYIEDHLGKDLEAKELSTLFTMDNVSNTVFGINSNCFADSDAAFRKVGDLLMKETLQVWWKTMAFTLLPKVRDIIGLSFVPGEVADYIRNLIREVMDFRKKNKVSRNDLLHHFMKKEPGNDVEEIMFYGMTFFVEGFESSSGVASSAIFELALNPKVQQTLNEEIRDAFGDSPDFNYDTISSLPYLDRVLKESMRKYPLLYNFTRICTKDTTLQIDGKSIEIEAGTSVIIPVFALHFDPLYYPNPDKFDPERFSEENIVTRPNYTYMPFGEGPRICPGIKFGLAQVKLLVANLVYKYRIMTTEKTPKKLTFQTGSFLVVPNEQEWIKFEKRK